MEGGYIQLKKNKKTTPCTAQLLHRGSRREAPRRGPRRAAELLCNGPTPKYGAIAEQAEWGANLQKTVFAFFKHIILALWCKAIENR